MGINCEALHAEWLSGAERYCWSIGGQPSRAAIILPLSEEPIDQLPGFSPEERLLHAIFETEEEKELYESLGVISLPNDAAELAHAMARHTLATPLPAKIRNLEGDFSYETFCLGELLVAAFPRDTNNDIFKMNIGSLFIGGWSDDEDLGIELRREYAMHRRFAGLGVILMNAVRQTLDGMLSDHEVVETTKSKELFLTFLKDETDGQE